MLQQNNQKQFDTIKEVDFRNRVSQKTESIVPSCKNTWDKFVEKDNLWKPKQALERKTHYREACQSVTDLICKLLNQQNAPELDIETSDGDPMQFHYFMGIFHEVVERKVEDAQGRLTRLIKFTKDEAKEMVKTFYSYHVWLVLRLQRDCCMKDMEIHTKSQRYIEIRSKNGLR